VGVAFDECDEDQKQKARDMLAEYVEPWGPLGWEAPEPKWMVHMDAFHWRSDEDVALGPFLSATAFLDELGQIIRVPGEPPIDLDAATDLNDWHGIAVWIRDLYGGVTPVYTRTAIMPFWFAVSLLHCTNVDVTEKAALVHTDTRQKRKLRKVGRRRVKSRGPRKQTKARIRYHVLDIQPGKQARSVSPRDQDAGRTVARHLVRGHWKDYRHGPGLGRSGIKGVFWWGPHVRGTDEAGTVLKDYREKRP
jgi:hypothetical protein